MRDVKFNLLAFLITYMTTWAENKDQSEKWTHNKETISFNDRKKT